MRSHLDDNTACLWVLLRCQHHLSYPLSRYRLKPASGGLRTKVMKLDGWLLFMNNAALIDSQFTIQVWRDL